MHGIERPAIRTDGAGEPLFFLLLRFRVVALLAEAFQRRVPKQLRIVLMAHFVVGSLRHSYPATCQASLAQQLFLSLP